MLSDPLALAANSPNPAVNFAIIRTDGYGTERRDAGGAYAAVINHSSNKSGDRHYVKIVKTVNATNPYNGLVSPQSASISLSFAKPAFGFTEADLSDLYTMLQDLIEEANVDSILSFQS